MSNPFKYGPIALDESFTDRDAEVAELSADALNGQDVVIFAPRRYGKTSLVHRVAQRLATRRALVAEVNLWFTPTKERLAGRLAREVADILGLAGKARAQLATGGPVQGQLTADVAALPPSRHVDPRTGHVLPGAFPIIP